MTTNQLTISEIQTEIGVLTKRLQHANDALIDDCVMRLRAGGLEWPSSIKPTETKNEYRYALHRVPAWGLIRAVEKLKRGETTHTGAFMPLPAQLAHMARIEAQSTVDDLTRLKTFKSQRDDLFNRRRPAEPTEEEQRQLVRIRELHDHFRQSHEATKAIESTGAVGADPLDYESAVYWTLVSKLPDAPGISAEQKAFRHRINREVATSTPPDAARKLIDDN